MEHELVVRDTTVTKLYADSIVSGLSDFKSSVKYIVERSALAAYTQAGAGAGATLTANANGALPSQDGQTPTVSRLLPR